MLRLKFQTKTPEENNSSISALFKRMLPSVRADVADSFADGMQAYFDAFVAHGVAPQPLLSVHAHEDLWVYSPHFKKVMALAIGQLFNTKITGISTSSSFETWQTIVYLDAERVRWTTAIQQEGEVVHISALFPLPDTKVSMVRSLKMDAITEQLTGGNVLNVNDISLVP